MKKTTLSLALILTISFLSGCAGKSEEKKETQLNPFSPTSMVETYDSSKKKINDSVQKENEKINNAIEDSGINE